MHRISQLVSKSEVKSVCQKSASWSITQLVNLLKGFSFLQKLMCKKQLSSNLHKLHAHNTHANSIMRTQKFVLSIDSSVKII